MPITITNSTGDPTRFWLDTSIELPDSGTSVIIAGVVKPTVGNPVAVTGSPLTAPAAPGSGSIFWNIQVDGTTGAATVQQSTSVDPALLGPNSIVAFRQTLVPGQADIALVPDSTPDA